MSTPPLYKTVIIIWSRYDGAEMELHDLAFQAEEGDAYCSKQESALLRKPDTDPDWPGTDFFEQEDDLADPPLTWASACTPLPKERWLAFS